MIFGNRNTANINNFESNKNMVINIMKELTKFNNIVHRCDIWQHCMNHMSELDFNRAINDMLNDGSIYTTVDNDSFSITC